MKKLPKNWRERLELVATCDEANCQGVAFVQYELRFREGVNPNGCPRVVGSVCVSPNKRGDDYIKMGSAAENHGVQYLVERDSFAWVEELSVHDRFAGKGLGWDLLNFLLCQYGCLGTSWTSLCDPAKRLWQNMAEELGLFHTDFFKSLLYIREPTGEYSFQQPAETTWVWAWSHVLKMLKDGRPGYQAWEEAHLADLAAAEAAA